MSGHLPTNHRGHMKKTSLIVGFAAAVLGLSNAAYSDGETGVGDTMEPAAAVGWRAVCDYGKAGDAKPRTRHWNDSTVYPDQDDAREAVRVHKILTSVDDSPNHFAYPERALLPN